MHRTTRWIIVAGFVVGLVAGMVISVHFTLVGHAQPPVPHPVKEKTYDCLACHQSGVADAPSLAADHIGRGNDDCRVCHEVSTHLTAGIPHTIEGRGNCLTCHEKGIGTASILQGNHVNYTKDDCLTCHSPSEIVAELIEPTATVAPAPPTVAPQPTAPPPTPFVSAVGQSTCTDCHSLLFADERHATFSRQPLGDAAVGEALFADLCVDCHGEDGGTVLTGEDGRIVLINSPDFLGQYDEAALMVQIGEGAHGEMSGFATTVGGPLAWDEILNLVAFVRSWAPREAVSEAPQVTPSPSSAGGDAAQGGNVFALNCAMCHGETGEGSAIAPVPINDAELLGSWSDDDIRQVIDMGKGTMPPMAGQLTDAEIESVILFMRSWQ